MRARHASCARAQRTCSILNESSGSSAILTCLL
jgi:hypothetical protein